MFDCLLRRADQPPRKKPTSEGIGPVHDLKKAGDAAALRVNSRVARANGDEDIANIFWIGREAA